MKNPIHTALAFILLCPIFSYSQQSGKIISNSVAWDGQSHSNYYHVIPASQAIFDTLSFRVAAKNTDTLNPQNIFAELHISSPQFGDTIWNSDTISISQLSTDTFNFDSALLFIDSVSQYSYSYYLFNDSMDTLDYVHPTAIFVSDTVMSWDTIGYGNIKFDPDDSYEIGNWIEVKDSIKATSIGVGIGNQSTEGEIFSVYLYNSDTAIISKTEFNILTYPDTNDLLWIPIPEVYLKPGKYLVSCRNYSDELFVRRSTTKSNVGSSIQLNGSGKFSSSTTTPTIALGTSDDMFICDLVAAIFQISQTSIICEATGGTQPYSYQWNTGDTTEIINCKSSFSFTYSVTVTDKNKCENFAESPNYCLDSIEESSLSKSITIHPNPTTNHFFIKNSNENNSINKIEIFNSIGQKIDTRTNIPNEYQYSLPSNLHSGLYWIHIFIGEQKITKPLIIR